MSTHSCLLATKTQRPKLPLRLVERDRLFARMAAARGCTLTVIKAAAGFGKTCLALAWADHLARQHQRIAWVSLDQEDNGPEPFLLYVAQALRAACPEIEDQVQGLIAEVALIRPLDVVRLLLNALAGAGTDVFLFLDDYHVLSSPEIGECTSYLLRHAPPQLHVVLTTRVEPDLPLTRLRAQNRLAEIDAAELRFDLDETRRFLEQEALGSAGVCEAAALQEKTEGWPVMMRIVAATSQQSGQDFGFYVRQLSGRHRPIRSHLIDMLDGLPAETVEFLLKTAILESLCAPLCAAVSGASRAGEIFETLVSHQLLLTPLDAEGFWFRCHPLLRSFLLLRLEAEMPGAANELHRRAYAWYAAAQRWTDAIRHALAVGDTGEAVAWVENCAMALLRSGDLLTLLTWERSFPPGLMRRQVKARLAIAWGMALAMRFDEALQRAAQIETEIGEADPERREAIGCECETIRAVALALSDDTDGGLELAEDSLKRQSSGPWTTNVASNVALMGWWKRGEYERCHALPWISFPGGDGVRNIVATVYRLSLLGLVEYEQLHQTTAERHFTEALRVASGHAGPHSASAAQPAALLAQCLYEQGRLDEAGAMLRDRLPAINAVCMLEGVLRAYTVLIRIALARGARDEAEAYLTQASLLALARRWPRLEARVLLERVRIALSEGCPGEAATYVSRLRRLREDVRDKSPALRNDIQENLDLAAALLHATRGETEDAAALLHAARVRLAASGNKAAELICAATQAMLLAEEQALPALRAALALAAPCGRVQVLLDLLPFAGKGFSALLPRAVAAGDPPRMAALARLIASHLPTPPEPGGGPLPLSPRERNILQLLVDGKSNKTIARDLNVAPETIKTHVKRIFQKLNVSNRSQAVAKYCRGE